MMTYTQHHPKKVLIWSAIGWNFKSQLIFFEKSVKSENYIDDVILNSDFVDVADRCWGFGKWIFQQDNAPVTRSSETKPVLKQLGLTLLDWHPYK